jgi:hypothetical protein
MATVQDGPPKPVKESEPLIVGPESARRLIVVAVGWFLLAEAVPQAVGFFRGFATGFVRGITKGDSQLEIPPTLSHLLVTVGAFGLSIVLLYAVSIRGRIVGGGDRRVGLRVAPIARLPIIIGLSTIDFSSLLRSPFGSHYLTVWYSSSLLHWPKSFFRGWLWTGLQKHWSVLPTGMVTAVMWLILKGVGTAVLLLFPALILTIARQVGKSVRADTPSKPQVSPFRSTFPRRRAKLAEALHARGRYP